MIEVVRQSNRTKGKGLDVLQLEHGEGGGLLRGDCGQPQLAEAVAAEEVRLPFRVHRRCGEKSATHRCSCVSCMCRWKRERWRPEPTGVHADAVRRRPGGAMRRFGGPAGLFHVHRRRKATPEQFSTSSLHLHIMSEP